MQEITREQAESLMANSQVTQSSVNHQGTDLVVNFSLSDRRSLRVCYNAQKATKSYFLNGDPISEFPG